MNRAANTLLWLLCSGVCRRRLVDGGDRRTARRLPRQLCQAARSGERGEFSARTQHKELSVCCDVRSWESLKDLTHSWCVSASVCVLRDQRNLLLPARRQLNTPQVQSNRCLLLCSLLVFFMLWEKIKSLWTLTCREKVGGQEGSSWATWAPASERPGSRYSPDHFGPIQTAFSLQLLQQL